MDLSYLLHIHMQQISRQLVGRYSSVPKSLQTQPPTTIRTTHPTSHIKLVLLVWSRGALGARLGPPYTTYDDVADTKGLGLR
jgi:hypothetical protein